MKKKVNALVPAAAVLVILCAAYGLITWHQHRKADELAGQAEDSQIYVTDIQGLTSISWEKAGQGLAQLHAAGLHHGRPALRDIAYDKETGTITFLDWENEKKFVDAPAPVLDLFLFLHSCFREEWPDNALIDAAVAGYGRVEGSSQTMAALKEFITDHHTLFACCHALVPFGWIDVVSVDKAQAYITAL